MAENRNIVLSAKDIEVKFRVRDNYLTAIRGVSLDLYEGETFAIVGESGSGKSVFTKTFTGMLESNGSITNGSVMFEGKDLTKLKTDKDWEGIRGAKISTIFQDPMTSLNPIRTIGSQITEVIEKHQGISRGDAKKQAIELMERVGIQNAADRFDEYPFQYSGGMRQRIVIAIALSCHRGSSSATSRRPLWTLRSRRRSLRSSAICRRSSSSPPSTSRMTSALLRTSPTASALCTAGRSSSTATWRKCSSIRAIRTPGRCSPACRSSASRGRSSTTSPVLRRLCTTRSRATPLPRAMSTR